MAIFFAGAPSPPLSFPDQTSTIFFLLFCDKELSDRQTAVLLQTPSICPEQPSGSWGLKEARQRPTDRSGLLRSRAL